MKIAIFYHCRLNCSAPVIDPNHAQSIMHEQMLALRNSGLLGVADKMVIGVNGGENNFIAAACLAPDKASMVQHSNFARGELSTINLVHKFAQENPGWALFYHHIKGATNQSPTWAAWRRCMTNACVWNWQQCYKDLANGVESVGAHWMEPSRYPICANGPYWGGNFWWATTDFLRTLPPPIGREDDLMSRYECELWIRRGKRLPVVRDYAIHFPMQGCR